MMKDYEQEVEDEIQRAQINNPAVKMPKLKLVFTDKGVDKRRFNIPRSNDVAVVFRLEDDQEVPKDTGIVVHMKKGRELKILNKFQKEREPMLYPLFFASGKDHKSHTVQRLTLHLPDGQNIYWNDKQDIRKIVEDEVTKNTTLTAWLQLNNPKNAR
ncbi:hypothetical protein Ddc_24948 [Ditylenchus destructor]|nr:hypothetical protein Ddc_24948 [Ditylenchus destructor]